jgi:polysaccharide pyruvyl transferase WcaK-like protein
MARRPLAAAVWGTFDVDNYGDHLFPRIARRELQRRLPGLSVDAFSPFGSDHPTRLDDPGHPVRGLGAPTDARRDELARTYDTVLVGGGELLHLNDELMTNFYDVAPSAVLEARPSAWFLEALGPERERRCPVVWHGLGVPFDLDPRQSARVRAAVAHRPWATVRDHASARRLREAGVSVPVDIVPDSGLVVDRLFSPRELERRVDELRRRRGYPTGPALVLQGCDLLVPHAGAIAAALRPLLDGGEVAPVLLETGRCRQDASFADALGAALGGDVWRVSGDVTVPDIVAVLAAADAVVGSSLHAAVTAVAFRRPFVVLNLGAEAKLDGFGHATGLDKHVIDDVDDLRATLDAVRTQPPAGELVADLQAAVDRHFDRITATIQAAARARRPWWRRGAPIGPGARRR